MDWIELLTPVAAALISIFCGWAVTVFRKWAKAQDAKIAAEIGESNYRLAESVVKNVVHGIEQKARGIPGPEKKKAAQLLVAAFLDGLDINIDRGHIDQLIEAVVLGLDGGNRSDGR